MDIKLESGVNLKTSSNKIYLIIIVLLLASLVIISYYAINVFGKIGYIPTGNIDIFQIRCDKDDNDKCSDAFSENSYMVYDNNVSWHENTELRIFSNPAYEFKNIIAPGVSNSYQFVILNNEKYNIKYNLFFVEENSHGVNMVFKLRKNKEYILGDSDTYKSITDLNSLDYELMGSGHDTYLLDWKWVHSTNDTSLSFLEANYKLSINITASNF